jgi:hypothetical protein
MQEMKAEEVELSEVELDAIFGGHASSVCRCTSRSTCRCDATSRCARVCVA